LKYIVQSIDDLIKASGKTQDQVARSAGITSGRIGNWKAYRDELNEDVISKLAVILKVTPEELLKARPPRPGSIQRFVLTPEQLQEAQNAKVEPVRGDFEGALRFVTDRFDDETLKSNITAAVEQGRSGVARVLLDLLDLRASKAAPSRLGEFGKGTSSSPDDVAREALKKGVASAKNPHVVYGRSPKAASTSDRASSPEPDVEKSSEDQP
jgi:transcriptional regulator with XRE-family HTH domain